jgi:hypothetical protein
MPLYQVSTNMGIPVRFVIFVHLPLHGHAYSRNKMSNTLIILILVWMFMFSSAIAILAFKKPQLWFFQGYEGQATVSFYVFSAFAFLTLVLLVRFVFTLVV